MKLPLNIESILNLLMESEARWKAQYMAVWGYSYHLRGTYENTPDWEKKIGLLLPASKYKKYEYTPKELHSIVTSMDDEFTLGHLQKLFAFFEELINDACPVLYPGEKVDAYKISNMEKFLMAKGKFNGKIKFVSNSEFNELKLAKETRNCYIHNNGKIDNRFVKAYEKARGTKPTVKEGEELFKAFPVPRNVFGFPYNILPTIEDWHSLIIGIVTDIKSEIEAI